MTLESIETRTQDGAKLLANRRFVRYALAKLAAMVGQSTLVYGLFVLVIQKQESSIWMGLFILSTVLPSVLLSLPGGFVADRLPRKVVIVSMLALRAAVVLPFLVNDVSLGGVLLLSAATSATLQFFGPADSATLPAVVPAQQLTSANAVTQVITLISYGAGAGLFAPIALKVWGKDLLFILVAGLLLLALFLYATTPSLTAMTALPRVKRPTGSVLAGWRFLHNDRFGFDAAVQMVFASAALTMLLVAAPLFIRDELHTSAENAVYIFAPGAIGAAVGLALAPPFAHWAGNRLVAFVGFLFFAGAFLALGFINQVASGMDQNTPDLLRHVQDWLHVDRKIAATVTVIPIGGFGLSLVNVSARTVLYERAPALMIAQVMAAQSMMNSLVAIIPTLAAGAIVDHVDVRGVLVGIGLLLAVIGASQLMAKAEPARQHGPAGHL